MVLHTPKGTCRAGLSNVHSVQVNRRSHLIGGPHHKANVKIVIDVKCIESIEKQQGLKKVTGYYGKKCGGPTRTVHTLPR